MQRPIWVSIIGVLGIIFGTLGLFGAGQTALAPKMMQMQRNVMEEMSKAVQKPEQKAQADILRNSMNKFLGDQPAWFASACVALGLLGLVVNGMYLYGGIALLQLKPFAVKFFSLVLWFSIVLGLVRSFVFVKGFSMMGIAVLFGAAVSIVIDVILLVVMATSDKSAFAKPTQPGAVA